MRQSGDVLACATRHHEVKGILIEQADGPARWTANHEEFAINFAWKDQHHPRKSHVIASTAAISALQSAAGQVPEALRPGVNSEQIEAA